MLVESPSGDTLQGPFSARSARVEEQPGPPVSHWCVDFNQKWERNERMMRTKTRRDKQREVSRSQTVNGK